ncbi:EGF-like domain-containing protein [Tieghemostelium lacteum]|uniref:EGF-like domain-containing protein n=1 Tax=Tieghemostelium lacteum TaxID=361077 RepID=A0A151Z8M4_TIELA|nr:EGF-like domain-containing protein [Tieghemostelium lacteum]|eukprot:KYQ90312.1 EGF-like domain-containing protein [Tieghemostelium lacteum]
MSFIRGHYVFLILVVFYINFINSSPGGFDMIDRTPANFNNKYGDDTNGCNFIFYIQYKNTNDLSGITLSIFDRSAVTTALTSDVSSKTYVVKITALMEYGESSTVVTLQENEVTKDQITITFPQCQMIPNPFTLYSVSVSGSYIENSLYRYWAGTYMLNFNLIKSYYDLITVYCGTFICEPQRSVFGQLFINVHLPPSNTFPGSIPAQIPIIITDILGRVAYSGNIDSIMPSLPVNGSYASEFWKFYPSGVTAAIYPSTMTNSITFQKPIDTILYPFLRIESVTPNLRLVYETSTDVTFLSTAQITATGSYINEIIYFDSLVRNSLSRSSLPYTTVTPFPAFQTTNDFYFSCGDYTSLGYRLCSAYGSASKFQNLAEHAYGFSFGSTVMIDNHVVPGTYGFQSGTNKEAKMFIKLMISTWYTGKITLTNFFTGTDATANPTADVTPPTILSVQYYPFQNASVLVRIFASDTQSGIFRFKVFNDYYFRAGYSAVTLPFYNQFMTTGIFEAIIPFNGISQPSDFDVYAYDNCGNAQKYIPSGLDLPFTNFPGTIPVSQFISSPSFISSFIFLYNNVDLTNINIKNTLFISFTGNNKNAQVYLQFDTASNKKYLGVWDKDLNCYAIDFDVSMNPPTGPIFYTLYYPDILVNSDMLVNIVGSNATLRFTSTVGADRMPPLVYSITTFTNANNMGYLVNIQDKVNGFKKGLIKVQSDIDIIPYEFVLDPLVLNKNPYNDNYTLSIPLSDYQMCNQNLVFRITYVQLIDNGNQEAVFDKGITTLNGYTGIDPLYQLNGNWDIPLQFTCTAVNGDVIPPDVQMNYVGMYDSNLDVGVINRKYVYNFSGYDANPISPRHIPYARASSLYAEFTFPCEMTITSLTNFTGTCTTQLPYGWAKEHVNGIYRIAIYGISDVLLNMIGFEDATATSSTKMDYTVPLIDGHYPFTSSGGSLTILGHKFGNDPSKAILTTDDGSGVITRTITFFSGIALVVNNIVLSGSKLTVMVKINGISSNNYTINPSSPRSFTPPPLPTPNPTLIPTDTPTNSSTDTPTDSSTDTPTDSSTGTPTDSNGSSGTPPVTTTPQPGTCPGQPICNGNGKCLSTGCDCNDKWEGEDCSSEHIPTDNPSVDPTKPTTNTSVEIPDGDGGYETISTLISVIALNELDFQNVYVKNHSLDLWYLVNSTTSASGNPLYIYTTTIQNQDLETNITVTIEFFLKNQTIEFAGKYINMKPSTLKYSIDITPYDFSSTYNYLQLVLSTGIQLSGDTKDSCIIQESGNTTDTTADYFKLQVDTHSLYARFIKRAMIDTNIEDVSSKVLSKFEDNPTTNAINTLIGINIPFYNEKVVLDPDFSILLDTTPASEKSDSLCTGKSKKKLSGAKIAGIVIGCVAFFAGVIAAAVFVFHKRSQNRKLNKRLQNINQY